MHGRTDRQFRDERRRRLAAVAAVARGQSQAVPRPVRRRLDAGQDAAAAGGAAGRRNADLPDRLGKARRPRPHRPRRDRAVGRRRDLRAGRPQHRGGGRRRHAADARPLWRRPGAGRAVRPRDLDRRASSGRRSRPALPAANDGRLVVFGIKPSQPETGYGYIEVAPARRRTCSTCRASSRSPISRPPRPISRPAISTGTPASSCSAPAPCAMPSCEFSPDIWSATEAAMKAAVSEVSGLYLPADLYAEIPSISIDYAIMERAQRHRHGARPASAGTISAPGSRCSTSARPTRTATSSSATSSRSTARTPTCAATAGCCRRSA